MMINHELQGCPIDKSHQLLPQRLRRRRRLRRELLERLAVQDGDDIVMFR